MQARTRRTFLGLGFDSDLIEKIDTYNQTVSGLAGQNKNALLGIGFSDAEADLIISKVNRSAISADVVTAIIHKSGGVCCYCQDGNASKPYQIHHIEEYHKSQNNNEENLLLVCPTHHVLIHQKKYQYLEQIHIKRKWERLWEIVKLFNQRGISFPFGSIEFVDYENEGSIIEIFNYAAPKPSICKILTNDKWRDEAVETLEKENKLIIAGESGSGKTTMVYGIAGSQSGKKVYKFTVSEGSNADSATQILLFLSLVKNVILIIDDANTKLYGEFIEKILEASSNSCQVIIVNTRNDFKSEHNVEQHFINSVKYIGWNEIRHTVKHSLLQHEEEVVNFLKDKLLNEDGLSLGFGELNTSLNFLINRFINSSTTVWQFLFLLGGGLQKVLEIHRELSNHYRFDIVFLYISIKQISEVEKGCTIDEIMELYKTNSVLKINSLPLKDSLKKELDSLCERRFLKNEFGRYKTIHRQFAKKFIENFYEVSSVECNELLDTVFNNYSNVKEIVILWSWLERTSVASYLNNWCNREATNWNELVQLACYESVDVLALLGHLMDYVSNRQNNDLVRSGFVHRASEIANLINFEETFQFYSVSKILWLLKKHLPEEISPLSKVLNQEKIVNSIKSADAVDFKYVNNIFSYIWEYLPEWIFAVAEKFDTADFDAVLKRVKKGDVESIDNIMQFFSNFVFDTSRSHLSTVTSAIYATLKDCPITEMSFPLMLSGLFPITVFPEDVDKILSALDSDKLADEIVEVTPRYWKKLLHLSVFSMLRHMDKLEEIVEKINLDILLTNIEKYYLDSSHEFKMLIHLFCNGSEKKKAEFAAKIVPFVSDICSKMGGEIYYDKEIIQIFYILSPDLASKIIDEYDLELNITFNKKPNLDHIEKKIEKEVETGSDFIISLREIDRVTHNKG